MSRKTTKTCDVCNKETDEIVAKLCFTPIGRGHPANSFHQNYTHHADVGACCSAKLLKGFNFTARKHREPKEKTRKKK